MKRLFTLISVVSMSLFLTKAQAQGFHIGIQVGANVYKTTGNDLEGKYRANPLAGAYLGFSGEHIRLTVEGNFTQTNMVAGNNFNQTFAAYIQNGKQQIMNAEFSFSELSVPVLLGFKLFPSTWVELGPQFTKIVNMNDKEQILNEITNVYKDSYISGAIGLRIKLPLHLSLTGRYVQGITNRNNSAAPDKWTTQHFMLGIGFGL